MENINWDRVKEIFDIIVKYIKEIIAYWFPAEEEAEDGADA